MKKKFKSNKPEIENKEFFKMIFSKYSPGEIEKQWNDPKIQQAWNEYNESFEEYMKWDKQERRNVLNLMLNAIAGLEKLNKKVKNDSNDPKEPIDTSKELCQWMNLGSWKHNKETGNNEQIIDIMEIPLNELSKFWTEQQIYNSQLAYENSIKERGNKIE